MAPSKITNDLHSGDTGHLHACLLDLTAAFDTNHVTKTMTVWTSTHGCLYCCFFSCEYSVRYVLYCGAFFLSVLNKARDTGLCLRITIVSQFRKKCLMASHHITSHHITSHICAESHSSSWTSFMLFENKSITKYSL